MAVMSDLITVLKNIFTDIYRKVINKKNNSKNSFLINLLTFGIFIAAIGYGGFYVYRWNVSRREASAQKTFSEAIELYEKARLKDSEKADNGLWSDVEGAFSFGYEQNSSSKLAPFFQLFQADALIELGKHSEAIELTEKAIKDLSPSNKLFNFYKTRLALMKIDSKEDSVHDIGLKDLELLAYDKDNKNSDVALFYLATYYADKNDDDKSSEAFQKLIDMQSDSISSKSPFSILAQEKLKTLG